MTPPLTMDENAVCFRIWEAMTSGDSAPYIDASDRIRGFIDEERCRMIAEGASPLSRNPFDSASAARQPEIEAF